MDLFTLFKVISLDAQVSILDDNTFEVLAFGTRSTIDIPRKLLDRKVTLVSPGIVTKIFLEGC